tara:strand:- start:4625 stop:4909 length:285 start_codon:yes stop_codon:yes gene_type:complete
LNQNYKTLKEIKKLCEFFEQELNEHSFKNKIDEARARRFIGCILRLVYGVDSPPIVTPRKYYEGENAQIDEKQIEKNMRGIDSARETLNRRRNR